MVFSASVIRFSMQSLLKRQVDEHMYVSVSLIYNKNTRGPKSIFCWVLLINPFILRSLSFHYNFLGSDSKPFGYPLMCIRLYAVLVYYVMSNCVEGFGEIK